MKSTYDKICKYAPLVLLIACSIFLYIILLLGSEDNDMYFEIMSGRDILNGNFKTATHLDNFPVIVQQYGYAILLALFDKLGYFGHILLVVIQHIILYALSYIFIKNKTNNKKLALISPYILILVLNNYMINIRPQIITVITIVAELILIEKYKSTKQNKYLFFVIPVLILAANLHQGVFLYHIFVLIPYFINSTKNMKQCLDLKLMLITPIYVLCSFCTPYFADGAFYTIKTLLSDAYKIVPINELMSMPILSVIGVVFMLSIAYTMYLLYNRRLTIHTAFYTYSIFILSLINIRHVSILYIAGLFIICSIDTSKLSKVLGAFAYGGISLICLIFIIIYVPRVHSYDKNFGDIANIIEDKDAKIYNSASDTGGFLEYNGYTKITFDSRYEIWAKTHCGLDNILENLYIVKSGYNNKELIEDDKILDIVEDYDYMITLKDDYINKIANTEWEKIFNNKQYVIWKKLK